MYIVEIRPNHHSLLSFGTSKELGQRYIGYEKPYATSHEDLDDDEAFQKDVQSAAITLANAIELQACGNYKQPGAELKPAIQK